jgi:Tol biopolymer transport system component
VAFESDATTLVGGNNNDSEDIFVHDRKTKKTKSVSLSSNGDLGDDDSEAPSISASGRFVAFESDANNFVGSDNGNQDIFVHDRKTKKTKRVSVRSNGAQANEGSFAPSISADGRFVAFESMATNLVGADDNVSLDIFMRGPLR